MRIEKEGKKDTLWPMRDFEEVGGSLGVVASNGRFGVLSLQVECKDARNYTDLD